MRFWFFLSKQAIGENTSDFLEILNQLSKLNLFIMLWIIALPKLIKAITDN